jgi:hypothetical protein
VPSGCHLKSSDGSNRDAWVVGVDDERGFIILEVVNKFLLEKEGTSE